MSDGYWLERLGECEYDGDPDPEPITRESVWVTRERARIPVYALGDSHLLNIIRVLRGKSDLGTVVTMDAFLRREWLNAMANEAYSRGLTIEGPDGRDPVHE